MKRVKVIEGGLGYAQFENAVNAFLSELGDKLVDIQYSTCSKRESGVVHTALIIYTP